LNIQIKIPPFVVNIFDPHGKIIGRWSCRNISSPEDLLPHLKPENFLPDLLEIMEDIRTKITTFPVLELTDFSIDANCRRKGYGRKGMREFLDYAKAHGYQTVVVKIGKHSPDDCLEGNTLFYQACGWTRFVTPSEYSLRFAYQSI
jgi:GNAT superfamily N-acetyltransferase